MRPLGRRPARSGNLRHEVAQLDPPAVAVDRETVSRSLDALAGLDHRLRDIVGGKRCALRIRDHDANRHTLQRRDQRFAGGVLALQILAGQRRVMQVSGKAPKQGEIGLGKGAVAFLAS